MVQLLHPASFRTELQIYPLSNRFYTTTGVLAPSTPNQLVIAPSPNRNEDVSNRATIRADCISTSRALCFNVFEESAQVTPGGPSESRESRCDTCLISISSTCLREFSDADKARAKNFAAREKID